MEQLTPTNHLARLSRWQILLILVGFPVLYWLNGFLPWSLGLFYQQDRSYLIPFLVSICGLHWASVLAVVFLIRRTGGSLPEIGFHLSWRGVLTLVIVVTAIGAGLIWLRTTWPTSEAPSEASQMMYPSTATQRWFWIVVALSAGFCEEFVYRGFGICALEARGMSRWKAVCWASFSFVMIHGVFGVIAFPFLFLAGLAFSAIFLWRGSLTPVISIHAIFDVLAVAAV